MDHRQGQSHRVGVGEVEGLAQYTPGDLRNMATGERALAPDALSQSLSFFDDLQNYLVVLDQVLTETAGVLDLIEARTFGPFGEGVGQPVKPSTPSASAPAVLAHLRDAITRAHLVQDYAHRLNARL